MSHRIQNMVILYFLALIPSPLHFVAVCQNLTRIGHKCNISGTICDLLWPCENRGACHNAERGNDYNCSCRYGFHGPKCEYDHRSCKNTTCSNHGTSSILHLFKIKSIFIFRFLSRTTK